MRISWINFGSFGSNFWTFLIHWITELIHFKALQKDGVGQNEATKQASLKYLDKFGQPTFDDFAMTW